MNLSQIRNLYQNLKRTEKKIKTEKNYLRQLLPYPNQTSC